MSKKLNYEDFLKKAFDKHADKYIYNSETELAFNGSHSIIPVICKKHGVFNVEVRRHINEGYGCNKCAIEYRAKNNMLTLEEFVKKAKKIHGDKYEYISYLGTKMPSPIVCKEHGIFYQCPNDHLSGKGCPLCNESHLEREIKNILNENSIKYEYRKHFNWLGKQEVDLYLSDYNIAIECQGKQHFGFGGWSKKYDFKKQIVLDKLKNKLCKENNINLIYFIDKKISKINYPSFYNMDKCFTNKEEILDYVKNYNNRVVD